MLRRLEEIGVGLAIEDFGTGHSSLAYLRSLPVHELKIDRLFVMNLSADAGDAVIVRSTIDLGHNLGLRVVAEGVEDEQALHWLTDHGCDAVQGYGIGRPLPASGLPAWLDDWRARERARTAAPAAATVGAPSFAGARELTADARSTYPARAPHGRARRRRPTGRATVRDRCPGRLLPRPRRPDTPVHPRAARRRRALGRGHGHAARPLATQRLKSPRLPAQVRPGEHPTRGARSSIASPTHAC